MKKSSSSKDKSDKTKTGNKKNLGNAKKAVSEKMRKRIAVAKKRHLQEVMDDYKVFVYNPQFVEKLMETRDKVGGEEESTFQMEIWEAIAKTLFLNRAKDLTLQEIEADMRKRGFKFDKEKNPRRQISSTLSGNRKRGRDIFDKVNNRHFLKENKD
jgi:hypothetical protein